MDDISKKIMEQIEDKKVQMRPRIYFIVRGILAMLGLIITALLSILITSFFLFFIQVRGIWLLPEFGLGGFKDLLLSLPIIIMSLVLIFAVIFWWFTRRHAFSYRRPVAYSLLVVIVLVIFAGLVVARTPLHYAFFKKYGRPSATPGLMHVMYGGWGREPVRNTIMGEVVNINGQALDIITVFRKYCRVVVSDNTFKLAFTRLSQGDWIFARGQADGGQMTAYGIRQIEPGDYALESLAEPDSRISFVKLEKDCSR